MTRLGQVLIAYQQKHDLDGKALATEIGINESSLTRVKQGRMPDAAGFTKILVWLMAEREA